MLIYPAIDLRGGRVVRLTQGDYDRMTVYGDDPVAVAQGFVQAGATCLHAVDLDGAKDGSPQNRTVIGQLCKLPLSIEVGGGMRTEADVEATLALGADRVILGTVAVEDFGMVERLVARWGARIAVGVDARGGRVAVSGWRETSAVEAGPFCASLAARGVSCVIHTDISRDGALCGVNLAAYRALLDIPGLAVVASGGVAGAQDLRALAALGVHGAIVGRALYEGRLDVAAALEAAGEEGA